MSKIKLRKLIKYIIKTNTLLLIGLVVIVILNELFFGTTELALNVFLWIALAIVMATPVSIVIVFLIYFVKNKDSSQKKNIQKQIFQKKYHQL